MSAFDPNDLINPILIPINDPRNPVNFVSVPNGFGKQLEDNLGYNLGLSLRIPIFNGFQTKAAVNRAVINNKRVSFRKEQAEQDLRFKIERAYADAKATLNQYEASKTSVKAQEESFKNAQDSYDLGVMTSFEFDQVRNRLVNAQSALVNAKYNFLFKSKLLEFYYGIPIVIA
jgi:outer membrane protein